MTGCRWTSWKAASPRCWSRRTRRGIPLLIPGERFNRTIVEYLKFVREFNEQFPGFHTDVHGLVAEKDAEGRIGYYVDCVDRAHEPQEG